MELLSILIENYKSIEDSNEYSVAPVTCLVGKNESGKTNILEAIYKLNPDIPERGNFTPFFDYPRRKLSEYLARAHTYRIRLNLRISLACPELPQRRAYR